MFYQRYTYANTRVNVIGYFEPIGPITKTIYRSIYWISRDTLFFESTSNNQTILHAENHNSKARAAVLLSTILIECVDECTPTEYCPILFASHIKDES